MSPFRCSCGERHAIFGEGGGTELAATLRVPLLATVPLDTVIAHGGDTGQPAMSAIEDLIATMVTDLTPPAGAAGCSARLLDAVERAVGDYSS